MLLVIKELEMNTTVAIFEFLDKILYKNVQNQILSHFQNKY